MTFYTIIACYVLEYTTVNGSKEQASLSALLNELDVLCASEARHTEKFPSEALPSLL